MEEGWAEQGRDGVGRKVGLAQKEARLAVVVHAKIQLPFYV